MRKTRPKSIYPDDNLWNRVKLIAEATNNVPARTAVTLIKRGVKRWERRQQQLPQLK